MPLYYKALTNGLQYAPGWLLVSSVRSVLSSGIYKLNCQDLKRLFAGFSLRTSGFDPRSVRVKFVVDNVAMGRVFFPPVLRFSPVRMISPMLLTQLPIRFDLTRRTKTSAISAVGECWIEEYFYTYSYYHRFVYRIVYLDVCISGAIFDMESHVASGNTLLGGAWRGVPIVRKFPGFAQLAFC